MAERRGPPTCWKNRLPATLQDMLWVAEHMCRLVQGKSGTLYIAMDLENPQCQLGAPQEWEVCAVGSHFQRVCVLSQQELEFRRSMPGVSVIRD